MADVKEIVLRELRRFAEIFRDLLLELRGASVFIVVDKVTREANVRLIDLNSVELVDQPDPGVNLGLTQLIKHFEVCN